MKNQLRVASDLTLPLSAVTETFGILAARGSGKSNLAAVLAEQMFDAGLPFVVVDPVGSWFGLRAGADGQKDGGLPIPIFGGHHGDVPLERGGGELLADLVVSKRLSCVLDLSAFESESAKKQFLLAFAQRLYLKNTDPLHLFLEEADDYIPQRPMRDEAQLLRAWENIVRRGRSRGLGMTLITQRSASISKSVLTQVQTLFVLRTTGPQDRAAIEAWVKYHDTDDKVLSSLSGLASGEGWAWSPQFLGRMSKHKFHRRRTFDSGATPKNLRGKDARAAATLADVDLSHLTQQMAATVERAKADDPKELKKLLAQASKDASVSTRRISELETRLLNTSGFALSNEKAKKEQPVLTDVERELLTALERSFRNIATLLQSPDLAEALMPPAVQKAIDRAFADAASERERARTNFLAKLGKAGFQRIIEKLDRVSAPTQKTDFEFHKTLSVSSDSKINPSKTGGAGASKNFGPTRGVSTSDGLPPARQKILNALAFFEGIGVAQTDKTQLALIVGVSPTSGGYFNNLGALRSSGLIEYPQGGTVALTSEGRALAIVDGVPETTRELHDAIRAKLPPAKWRIIQALIARYPHTLTKDALAGAIGVSPTSGGYFNNLGSLRSLGLIGYPRPSEVVALPVLFLEGR